jgi:glutathione synthase/RimK-type ligase-like ATP-grasp enzyme
MRKIIGVIARKHENITPFGNQTFFFEDMVRESQNLAVDIIFFSPQDWVEGSFEIDGFSFLNNEWTFSKYKIPRIIFDRFISDGEIQDHIKSFRNFLGENNFHVTNPLKLVQLLSNKLDFYKFALNSELPTIPTFLLRNISKEAIDHLINESKAIYLKPISGLKGNGISVLEKDSNNIYLLHLPSKQTIRILNTNLLEILNATFDPDCYIVQPKANSPNFNHSPFDIRVLVQNHGNKKYLITGMGVRVGEKRSWVANLSQGSKAISIYELEEFYQKHYGKDIKLEISRIENVCLNCCQKLHEQFGDFVEIGIDIMLTLDQGPLILEGNSKPGRWIFNQIADGYPENSENFGKYKTIRSNSVRIPIVFATNNRF